ncbi:3278_t:CDS:2 [Entrophospora sp. SA101]|nr:3278_t:CDS:2 [Entrophospora sp. SA101]
MNHWIRNWIITDRNPSSNANRMNFQVSSLRQEPKGLLKKEVYEYKAPWPVYGLDWSKLPGEKAFRLAVGSFIEEYSNKLEIISLAEPSTYDDDSYYHRSNIDFVKIAEADHHYPITKVLWEPYKGGSKTSDLLATTGDYLKLWEIVSDEANNGIFNRRQQLITKQTLKNKKVDFKAPLTSFDWNQLDSSLAVTSSIDTTCTVWNVETGQAKTQLIAHDKEVYDVAFFTNEVDTFASVGADGSVRLFDLRSLEHSTILYETPPPQPSKTGSSSNSSNQQSPLLRLSFNKISPYYIATFHMNSTEVIILDIRAPGLPVAELNGHNAPVNCVNWSPNSSNILCSGGDDCNAIVWDLGDLSTPNSTISKYNQDPLLAYRATSEVNQLSWNTKYPEWGKLMVTTSYDTAMYGCTAKYDKSIDLWTFLIKLYNHNRD